MAFPIKTKKKGMQREFIILLTHESTCSTQRLVTYARVTSQITARLIIYPKVNKNF